MNDRILLIAESLGVVSGFLDWYATNVLSGCPSSNITPATKMPPTGILYSMDQPRTGTDAGPAAPLLESGCPRERPNRRAMATAAIVLLPRRWMLRW